MVNNTNEPRTRGIATEQLIGLGWRIKSFDLDRVLLSRGVSFAEVWADGHTSFHGPEFLGQFPLIQSDVDGID